MKKGTVRSDKVSFGKYRRKVRYYLKRKNSCGKYRRKVRYGLTRLFHGKNRRKVRHDSTKIPSANIHKKKVTVRFDKDYCGKIEERHGLILQGFPRQEEERYGKIRLWLPQQIEKKDTVQLDNDACCK